MVENLEDILNKIIELEERWGKIRDKGQVPHIPELYELKRLYAKKVGEHFGAVVYDNVGFGIVPFSKFVKFWRKYIEIKSFNKTGDYLDESFMIERFCAEFMDSPSIHLEQEYPFITEDIFLRVEVNFEGKQKLIIVKKDKNGKDEDMEVISCIHTAITNLSIKEFKEINSNLDDREELFKESLYLRSSENIQEIHLSIPQKFIAMKSWAQGIAEAGENAFILQSNIEKYANLQYPIAIPLLKFMAKHVPQYLEQYVDYIVENSKYEGVFAESFVLSNLDIVFKCLKSPYHLLCSGCIKGSRILRASIPDYILHFIGNMCYNNRENSLRQNRMDKTTFVLHEWTNLNADFLLFKKIYDLLPEGFASKDNEYIVLAHSFNIVFGAKFYTKEVGADEINKLQSFSKREYIYRQEDLISK